MGWFILKLGTSSMMVSASFFGMLLMSCSSTPEPQPEPTKQEIRQDSDRFFHKMEKEEGKTSPSP
jgi:hypothetical protein